jgi:hypothetical protein
MPGNLPPKDKASRHPRLVYDIGPDKRAPGLQAKKDNAPEVKKSL